MIIEKACMRRIKLLQSSSAPDRKVWIRKYRTRYHKIRILNSFRQKHWLGFLSNLLVFPFVGGMDNMISYCRKLPKEGFSLIRKSFFDNYKILDSADS